MSKKAATTDDLLGNSVLPADATIDERQAERDEKEARLESADREKIDQIILSDDFGKGGKIRVSRKGPLDQAYQYVYTISADQWVTEDQYEYCKKMFGGGDYRCQTFRAKGSMYKPFEFSIDYRYKGSLDEQSIKQFSAEGSKGNGTTLSDTMRLVQMMQGNKEDGIKITDIMAMMKESSGKSEQSNMMMMTMMMKSMETAQASMMAMLTALVPALVGPKAATSGTDALLLELIKQKQEHSPMKDTLEMMAQIKDIFDPKKDEEEKDDMWSKIGRVALPVLKGLTGQGGMPNAEQATPTPVQIDSPPAAPGAQPQQPQAKTANLGGLFAMMPPAYQLLFSMAIAAAEKQSDPALYADIILDQVDEQGLSILQQTLTPPDWCTKLFGDETVVAHIRPWLEELRLVLLNPDNPEAENEQHGPKTNIPSGKFSGDAVSTGQPQA